MAQLAHLVYFTLHDPSPKKVADLVAACHGYLAPIEGIVYFSVGTLNRELNRPVNDLGYDVSLHVVFESRQAHDKYQVDPSHLKFIGEQKQGWKLVRIFDSDVVNA